MSAVRAVHAFASDPAVCGLLVVQKCEGKILDWLSLHSSVFQGPGSSNWMRLAIWEACMVMREMQLIVCQHSVLFALSAARHG